MSSELPDLNAEYEFKEVHDEISNSRSDNESRSADNDYHNILVPPRMESDEIVELIKRTRVSIRVRTEHGEMGVAGNYLDRIRVDQATPHFHYKCKGFRGCPIRKDVERNGNILTTIYYGANHNHPVALVATGITTAIWSVASMVVLSTIPQPNKILIGGNLLPSTSSVATITPTYPFSSVILDLTVDAPATLT